MYNRVLYIQYTNPASYPSLEHSSRMLADANWQVLFLGTGVLGAEKLRFSPYPRVAVRQIPFCPPGWRQKLHYLWFCAWVVSWLSRWRSRWVYTSDPLSCPIALLLSYLPGVRVIYHEHDSPNELRQTPMQNSPSAFARLVLWSRRRLGRRAQICVLPNQQRAQQFAQETSVDSAKILCAWNCPTSSEVAPPRPPHHGESLWVLFHGSIVPARLPSTVLMALAALPEHVKLKVVGYSTIGHRTYVTELRQLASELRIADRIDFVGALPTREQLLEHCRTCDVGLALMPNISNDRNERTMTGASNKPFDYLACGLALLVSDLPDWREMYVAPGYGLACDPDDPASIAAALRWFLEHPAEMRAIGERGRQRIESEWNYEAQFEEVYRRLC